MNLKKFFMVMFISVWAVLLLVYDGQAKEERGFDDNEIRIGIWAPQTGPAAPWGAVGRGSKFLFDLINEEGGIHGRKIKVFLRDDQYNPTLTQAVVKELVERYGVLAFSGGTGTANGEAVKNYLQENEIIWVAPGSGASVFYEPVSPYIWNVWPTYDDDASLLAKHAVERMKFKRIAVIYQNDNYGISCLEGVKTRLNSYKMTPVVVVPVEPTERDLASQLAKLKTAKPDAIIGFVTPTQAIVLLKESVNSGFKPQWIHTYNMSDYVFMNKISGGLWGKEAIISSAFTLGIDSNHPLQKKYREAAKRMVPNERWGQFFIAGIAAAEPLAAALKKVGRNLSTKALQDALNSMTDFQGVGPKLTWTAKDHTGAKALMLWQCGPNGEENMLKDWTRNELRKK